MIRDKLLMTPGPTMLPYRVREAMNRQILHHRTKEFEAYFCKMNEDLKKVFKTQNPVLTLASSGTGAMEAVLVNAFSPGDKVLAISVGVFGERFAKIAGRFGLEVKNMEIPWGKGVAPEEVGAYLEGPDGKDVKGVLITHNETSTGVVNDIRAIGQIVKNKDCILLVDAVSSLAGIELKADEWGLDMVVAGSQKALMLPPGLAFVSISDKAWDFIKKSKLPKFYFDFHAYKKSLGDDTTPYTPAVSLVIAASEALDMIIEEGLDKIFARHKNLALSCRNAVTAMGLDLFAEQQCASDLITSIKAPSGVEIDKARSIMNLEHDIMIAEGQQHLKGKIFRIGHMGYVDCYDLLRTISALEFSLMKVGFKMELGAGVAAAQKSFDPYL
jgi:aspartate aminotransferase-like enzyme